MAGFWALAEEWNLFLLKAQLMISKLTLRKYESCIMEINDKIKVKYLGISNPLMLLNGKIYEAWVIKMNWFAIVDETNEEYAYPPELFEIVE